jgi:hypothetical protein
MPPKEWRIYNSGDTVALAKREKAGYPKMDSKWARITVAAEFANLRQQQAATLQGEFSDFARQVNRPATTDLQPSDRYPEGAPWDSELLTAFLTEFSNICNMVAQTEWHAQKKLLSGNRTPHGMVAEDWIKEAATAYYLEYLPGFLDDVTREYLFDECAGVEVTRQHVANVLTKMVTTSDNGKLLTKVVNGFVSSRGRDMTLGTFVLSLVNAEWAAFGPTSPGEQWLLLRPHLNARERRLVLDIPCVSELTNCFVNTAIVTSKCTHGALTRSVYEVKEVKCTKPDCECNGEVKFDWKVEPYSAYGSSLVKKVKRTKRTSMCTVTSTATSMPT